jgi:uncharacterized protein YndB with AHSA1/START domain
MDTTNDTVTDRIERQVVIKAPRARVWQALTDHRQFSKWFGVEIAEPFLAGKKVRGKITHKGYEHLPFEILVERVEPERLFSWRWHPFAIEADHNYSGEPMTLVVFELSDTGGSTLLRVVESGFDALPAERRTPAFRGNSGGWDEQVVAIEKYLLAAGEPR